MKIEGLGAGFVDGYKASEGGKQHCTQCESLKAEVERLNSELNKINGQKKVCTDCDGTGHFINSKGRETLLPCTTCYGNGEVTK